MDQEAIHRKLAAIFSADVAGYTRLMQNDEMATLNLLSRYRAIMADLIKQHNGRVVDAVGDNLMAEFSSVVDAVQSAIAVQKELANQNGALAPERRMEFRIGINVGDVIQEGERIYGDGVNIAARLEKLASPGGICISKIAHDHIESKLPFGYEYLGEVSVKNLSKPLAAYRVILEPGAASGGPSAGPAGGADRDSFSRVREQVENFARDISQDQHLRKAVKETSERVRGFADEVAGDPASRDRALRRLWSKKHVQGFVFLALALFAINAITYWGRWWFQYPVVSIGLAFYIHWLKHFFFSEEKVAAMQASLRWEETERRGPDGGQAQGEEIEARVMARIHFYRHLFLYVGVIVFLFLLNMLTNPFSWWFMFPALGWGTALFFHWLRVKP